MLPWKVPFTLGHENSGWVEAVGAGVTNLEVGLPVAVYGPWGCGACIRCREGMENYCEQPATAAGGGLERVTQRRDFASHLVAYLVVNTALVVICAVTGGGYFWPAWVIGGWGIGLVLHGLEGVFVPGPSPIMTSKRNSNAGGAEHRCARTPTQKCSNSNVFTRPDEVCDL